jgi:hypothetical protein
VLTLLSFLASSVLPLFHGWLQVVVVRSQPFSQQELELCKITTRGNPVSLLLLVLGLQSWCYMLMHKTLPLSLLMIYGDILSFFKRGQGGRERRRFVGSKPS